MKIEIKKALIVFARKPVLGKVKTRLAATVGNEKALEIYKKLLIHTRTIVKGAYATYYAFLTEADEINFWEGFSCQVQIGETLGDRMRSAFDVVFEKGFEQCIIIGSDCPELTTELIIEAFKKLEKNEVVIGAAADGGYYLLGIKKMHPYLFKNKNWSTKNVFEETIKDIQLHGLAYHTMPVLNDVDEEKDIPEEWR